MTANLIFTLLVCIQAITLNKLLVYPILHGAILIFSSNTSVCILLLNLVRVLEYVYPDTVDLNNLVLQ
jgi:hypothetical protein